MNELHGGFVAEMLNSGGPLSQASDKIRKFAQGSLRFKRGFSPLFAEHVLYDLML